jgi:hypothetical protein
MVNETEHSSNDKEIILRAINYQDEKTNCYGDWYIYLNNTAIEALKDNQTITGIELEENTDERIGDFYLTLADNISDSNKTIRDSKNIAHMVLRGFNQYAKNILGMNDHILDRAIYDSREGIVSGQGEIRIKYNREFEREHPGVINAKAFFFNIENRFYADNWDPIKDK